MADPPVTPEQVALTEQATNANEKYTTSLIGMGAEAETARQQLDNFSGVMKMARNVFEGFESKLNNFGLSIRQTGALTEQQTEQFGLLTTAVFGTRKAFDSLQGVDSSKTLATFGDQVGYLVNTLKNSGGGISEIAKLAESAFGVVMPDAAKKSVQAATNFLGSLATSADNALRLQNAVVQLAARTGMLDEIYKKAGPNLENINSILASQQNAMAQSMKATGLNEKQIEDWYSALGTIPGALNATVTAGSGVDKSMSMLTATIKAATGTGRQQADVIKDMHDSYKSLGLTGENALKFTLRFSEISNAFNIDLEDVQSNLKGVVGELSHFADAGDKAAKMSEGLARVMKSYIGGLMDAGMTGRDAAEAAGLLEKSVGKLTIAQKGFISAQTGGPGGLLGGMQIDKMLRSGDFEGVMKKQMETMKKLMGGPIMTLDEVKTEADASRMQKQVQMMQQGPLGSMIKSPQDAYKMFDMMRGTRAGEKTAAGQEFKENIIKDSIDKGTKWEEKSYTQFTVMRNHLEAIRRSAETSNLSFLQKAGTASAGVNTAGKLTPEQRAAAQGLQTTMTEGAEKGGNFARDHAKQMRTAGAYIDDSGRYAATAIKDIGTWFERLPSALKAPLHALKSAISSGDEKAVNTELQAVEAEVKNARAKAKTMTGAERDRILREAQQKEDAARQAHAFYSQGLQDQTGRTGLAPIPRGAFGPSNYEGGVTPGAAVGAAPRPTAAPAPKGGGTGGGGGAVPTDVNFSQVGDTGRFKVNVVVKVQEDSTNSRSVTPAPKI